MPRFPRFLGSARVRVPELSRRHFMVGASATSAIMPLGIAQDTAIDACHAWQIYHAEQEELIKRWQALEAHLIRHHDWCRLSKRQRAAMPEATELDAIDDRLDEIHDQKQTLLAALRRSNATTPCGLAAKLTIAASIIHRQENPDVHDLMTSLLLDLQNLSGNKFE